MNCVQTLQRCTQATACQTFCTKLIPRNQSTRVQLPCPNHNTADPDTNPTETIPSLSLLWAGFTGPMLVFHTHICRVGGRGHSVPASHLNMHHMKRKYRPNVSIPPAHIYIHTSPSISLNEWGWGNHRTPKTAPAYKECEGPQPREQAGKPYHIWQQRQNLIFINEQSGHESGLTCKGWAPILDGVWYVLVGAL